jgi:uncharacterized protein YgbK (DUF1537 family)
MEHIRDEQHRAVQLSTRLQPDLARAIEQRARAERRTVSNLLAKLVADAIDRDHGAAA